MPRGKAKIKKPAKRSAKTTQPKQERVMVNANGEWMPLQTFLSHIINGELPGALELKLPNQEQDQSRGYQLNDAYAPKGDTTTKPATSAEYGDSVLGTQVGGNHYKKMGHYQPWEVLKQWLSPEEFRGYMKGTAIAYLAREQEKGKDVDVGKAAHTLEALLEMIKKA